MNDEGGGDPRVARRESFERRVQALRPQKPREHKKKPELSELKAQKKPSESS